MNQKAQFDPLKSDFFKNSGTALISLLLKLPKSTSKYYLSYDFKSQFGKKIFIVIRVGIFLFTVLFVNILFIQAH